MNFIGFDDFWELGIFYFWVFWISKALFGGWQKVEMSKAGALDLASGLGGKIDKDDVLSAVDKYTLSLHTHIYVCISL